MAKKNNIVNYLTIAVHIIVCVVVIVLPEYYYRTTQRPEGFSTNPSNFFIIINIFFIGFFYLNAYYLIPKLFLKGKKILYVLIITVTLIGATVVGNLIPPPLIIDASNSPLGMPTLPPRIPSSFPLAPFILSFALSSTYRFFLIKFKEDSDMKDQTNENLKTELLFLRSQISPHFMFNTLNSLVSLARKKSDLLEPILIKLSNLIRYMLYESETTVPVQTEVEYLKNYIELQQLRFGDKVEIIFNTQLSIKENRLEPMILIAFVENAFKHGIGMIQNPKIEINLTIDNNELNFNVWNRHNNQAKEVKDKNSGIGIPNIKRRLNLLYGENHNLTFINNDDWFMATLKLYLK